MAHTSQPGQAAQGSTQGPLKAGGAGFSRYTEREQQVIARAAQGTSTGSQQAAGDSGKKQQL